jgi:hypothetical protein
VMMLMLFVILRFLAWKRATWLAKSNRQRISTGKTLPT